MKNRIFLALYKGHGGDLLDKLTDFVVRVFTRGEFSHCEIAVEKQINFTDRYDCDTVYDCYSSSPREGGVRVKRIDVSDAKTWTLIPLNDVSENQIKAYFNRTLGKKYDFIGALGVVFGIKQKRSKYFCSEWCFNAIFGNENGWRFSPNQLAALLELEGYLLKQRSYEATKGTVTLRNGNLAEVVYQSPFGKLLVVEQTGEELPAVHWHNADGSFHKDENHQIIENELDIVAG